MLSIVNVPVRKTKIPVADLVQEAVDLKTVCGHDKEKLVGRGLDWKMVEDLDGKADILSRTEAKWVATKADCKAATSGLGDLVKECRKIRSLISTSLRRISSLYDLGFRVPAYSQKKKRADLVQDLHDMWNICNKKREFLISLGFDMSLADRAYELHLKLSQRIAVTVNDRPRLSPDHHERDRLRDELFSVVRIIREFARMVFTGDPQRCKKYTFTYYRTANRKRLSRLRTAKKILSSKNDGKVKSINGSDKSINGKIESIDGIHKTSNGEIKSGDGEFRSSDGKLKSGGLDGKIDHSSGRRDPD